MLFPNGFTRWLGISWLIGSAKGKIFLATEGQSFLINGRIRLTITEIRPTGVSLEFGPDDVIVVRLKAWRDQMGRRSQPWLEDLPTPLCNLRRPEYPHHPQSCHRRKGESVVMQSRILLTVRKISGDQVELEILPGNCTVEGISSALPCVCVN